MRACADISGKRPLNPLPGTGTENFALKPWTFSITFKKQ